MIVAVTGSSGFIGSALVSSLKARGDRVIPLVRRAPRGNEDALRWEPATGAITHTGSVIVDAVVHLAGESVTAGRWTATRKARIRDSRVAATARLAQPLARATPPPRVLVCASAIGYYANRDDVELTESSAPGIGFLAQVCREWEAATAPATARGIRVVNLRIGLALSAAGGALAKMLIPFRLGLGGVVGDGKQWMSWIALADLIDAIHHALDTEPLHGPVNAVAPTPVTNAEFTRTLGRVLGRPTTILRVPAFAARLAFGEMADELLLTSQRVMPARLQASGFVFRHPTLEGALRREIGRGH